MNIFWKIHNFVLGYLVYICQYIEYHKLDMPLELVMQPED
jgi:hypothetical protein